MTDRQPTSPNGQRQTGAIPGLREGQEPTVLVDGVSKLTQIEFQSRAEQQAENFQKMAMAMARDIRVLVIKLADRLHNARTWRYVSKESAARKANETLEIYAPLAHRLGMNTIKWELEDLSFATLYPKVYDEIVRMVAQRAPAREELLARIRADISEELKANKVRATVTGRPKHYYSIYQKMIVRGRDFKEIYDLIGQLADSGTAIVVVSSEIPEVLALADTVLVVAEGRIVHTGPATEIDEHRVLDLVMDSDALVEGHR